jgi:DNA repair protein RadC
MVKLEAFERSPGLSELKVAYRRNKKAMGSSIYHSADAEEYLRSVWNLDTIDFVEEFLIVCLNTTHQPFGWVKVSSGGFSATTVDPRVVFSIALQTASSALLVAHNHPSNNPEPSREDVVATQRLVKAGAVLGIKVLDHVILTRDRAVSLRALGLL